MRRAGLLLPLLSLLTLLGACGADGSKRYSGDPPDAAELYGSCSFCHGGIAERMIATGGHGDLSFRCEFCHGDDLRPGEVGPGHRNVPACADCHTDPLPHHDPAAGTADECLLCHTPHGSPNLALVRKQIETPSGAVRAVELTSLLGLDEGGLASATNPGSGVCETCHTQTRYYRSDGSGDPHFTLSCIPCHQHDVAFTP